jgi:hypothetical protein
MDASEFVKISRKAREDIENANLERTRMLDEQKKQEEKLNAEKERKQKIENDLIKEWGTIFLPMLDEFKNIFERHLKTSAKYGLNYIQFRHLYVLFLMRNKKFREYCFDYIISKNFKIVLFLEYSKLYTGQYFETYGEDSWGTGGKTRYYDDTQLGIFNVLVICPKDVELDTKPDTKKFYADKYKLQIAGTFTPKDKNVEIRVNPDKRIKYLDNDVLSNLDENYNEQITKKYENACFNWYVNRMYYDTDHSSSWFV